ncbi:unnamed protein product [Orchesella dallaii]
MTKPGVVADTKTFNALLQEYKECEERIRAHEKEDPLILYYVKQSRMRSIEETIKRHSETIEVLKNRVDADFQSVTNGSAEPLKRQTIRSALMSAGDSTKLSKPEQDMIAKRNQFEIANTELEMLFQEKAILKSDIQELKAICGRLSNDYKRQEEIAGQLSVSTAGRGEMELLDELANVETRRIKISEVYERWKEARIQVADSCRQFSSALQKWRDINDERVENQYEIAEEVRDELITALQFLANGKFYIQHEFPYCTKQEITILTKALTYIFVDMRTEDRRKHADSCYAAFHNRTVALYAWIDTTIKAVIQPVVTQTRDDLNGVMEEMQELRFQNIKQQFPSVTWQHNGKPETGIKTERSRSTCPGENLTDKLSAELFEQLDLSQLAPLPRTVEIFGKSTEDLVESYKTTLRESIFKEQDVQAFLENSVDGMVQKRRESLAEKDLVEEDTVGLA